ncbi:hypothetical protein V8E53_005754 [Lactarius tabidus]
MAAKASTWAVQVPPVASGSRRRLRRETCAESSSDSGSVEVVITSPMTKRRIHACAKAQQKKRRRVAHYSDPSEEHKQIKSDNEVEIIVDALRCYPVSTPPPIPASISVDTSSPPPSSPDINSLAGLPLTILPAPACTGIIVPPLALSHLQTSSSPPSDDSRTQQMQRQAIRQGFCCGGDGATTLDPGVQHGLDLDIDFSMGHTDTDADAVTDDGLVVPSPTPSTHLVHAPPSGRTYARLCNTRSRHCQPRSQRRHDASASGGEGWVEWRAQHGLGRTNASTDTGVDDTVDATRARPLVVVWNFRAMATATVPPSGLGKGKSKSRAGPVDGVVDSLESDRASSSTRVQRKRRRKPFPDEAEPEHRVENDDDHECDEADPRARAISAPVPRRSCQEMPADDIIVLVVGDDALPPLQAHDALTQDALYADRRFGRREVQ